MEGVTFAGAKGAIFVPIREICAELGWNLIVEGKDIKVDERTINEYRVLFDGTRMMDVRNLVHLGCEVLVDDVMGDAGVTFKDKQLTVHTGTKRVEINKKVQKLRAYQGDRLVAETPVSTGRSGFTTPSGSYTAGPQKARLRYSRKYNNAPMPYSVQIHNGYFMHGYAVVPRYPASHGCVRLPMWGANAARWLWDWIDIGTPIAISNDWATPDEDPAAGGSGTNGSQVKK